MSIAEAGAGAVVEQDSTMEIIVDPIKAGADLFRSTGNAYLRDLAERAGVWQSDSDVYWLSRLGKDLVAGSDEANVGGDYYATLSSMAQDTQLSPAEFVSTAIEKGRVPRNIKRPFDFALAAAMSQGRYDIVTGLFEQSYEFLSDKEKVEMILIDDTSYWKKGGGLDYKKIQHNRDEILADMIHYQSLAPEIAALDKNYPDTPEKLKEDPMRAYHSLPSSQKFDMMLDMLSINSEDVTGEARKIALLKERLDISSNSSDNFVYLLNLTLDRYMLEELEDEHHPSSQEDRIITNKIHYSRVRGSRHIANYISLFIEAYENAELVDDTSTQLQLNETFKDNIDGEYFMLKDWEMRLKGLLVDPEQVIATDARGITNDLYQVMEEMAIRNIEVKSQAPDQWGLNTSRIGQTKTYLFTLLQDASELYSGKLDEQQMAAAIVGLLDLVHGAESTDSVAGPDLVKNFFADVEGVDESGHPVSVVAMSEDAALASSGEVTSRAEINAINSTVFSNKSVLIALVRDIGPKAISMVSGHFGFVAGASMLKNYKKAEKALQTFKIIDGPESEVDTAGTSALTKVLSILMPQLVISVNKLDNEALDANINRSLQSGGLKPSGDRLTDLLRLNIPTSQELTELMTLLTTSGSGAYGKAIEIVQGTLANGLELVQRDKKEEI